jgi:hypothetical protein
MSGPLQSRFFIVELEPSAYEQFRRIAVSCHRVDTKVATAIANTVWNKSQDIRDCIKIGALAKTIEDVEFIVVGSAKQEY